MPHQSTKSHLLTICNAKEKMEHASSFPASPVDMARILLKITGTGLVRLGLSLRQLHA